MLAACLRRPGIHLTTCLEIEAALALLSAYRFDVVVTDLSVSQLGGLEGMRLIRFVTTNFPDTAVYVLSGTLDVSGDLFEADRLLVFRPGDAITLRAGPEGCHIMLFGGAALGSKRYIWWNFVSSSKERIEQAKEEWRTGRFDIVPGDEEEFVPLPEG